MSGHQFELPKCCAFLSADPGYFILNMTFDDDYYPTGANKIPIIGWAIDADDYCAYALTLDGVNCNDEDILFPDGHIEKRVSQWFNNIDEWLENKQREFLKRAGGRLCE